MYCKVSVSESITNSFTIKIKDKAVFALPMFANNIFCFNPYFMPMITIIATLTIKEITVAVAVGKMQL